MPRISLSTKIDDPPPRRVYNSAMYCYGIKCLRFLLNMPLVKATIAKFAQHSTTV